MAIGSAANLAAALDKAPEIAPLAKRVVYMAGAFFCEGNVMPTSEFNEKYGEPQESPIDELNISLGIFRNHLALIDELLVDFNATKFHTGTPLERLNCLNAAAEYVQMKKEMQTRFMGLSRRLKSAYGICFPSGELTEKETATAQFIMGPLSRPLKKYPSVS